MYPATRRHKGFYMAFYEGKDKILFLNITQTRRSNHLFIITILKNRFTKYIFNSILFTYSLKGIVILSLAKFDVTLTKRK